MTARRTSLPPSGRSLATRVGRDTHATVAASGTVALFDLDRTLVPGSSLVALGRMMASRGMVSRRRLLLAAAQDRRFRWHGATDAAVARLRADALRHVAGIEQDRLLEVLTEVGRHVIDDVLPGAKALLRRHRAAGDFIVILSASPQELVEVVAAGVGAHRAVGTRAGIDTGRYSGELDGPFCYGAGKIDRVTAELGSGVVESAVAYADSISDLPLLERAAEPIAVNPDRRLAQVARRNGWPVLRFS